ncbi:hypothetical protein [uncultured Selenomonas sp.]
MYDEGASHLRAARCCRGGADARCRRRFPARRLP